MVYHGRWTIANVLFMSFGDHASEFPIDPSNRHHHQQQQQQHLVSPERIRLLRRCHVPQQIQTICLYNYIHIYIYICEYRQIYTYIHIYICLYSSIFIFQIQTQIYFYELGWPKACTSGKVIYAFYEGNPFNLHYPTLSTVTVSWYTYEISDVYQCRRITFGVKKTKKSTVTVFMQGPL